jgi:hypothetical protein
VEHDFEVQRFREDVLEGEWALSIRIR